MSEQTISRIRFLAWVTGLCFALLLFVADAITFQKSHGISINGSALWGRDFANVYSSGRLAIEHHLSILYDPPSYRAWQAMQFGWGINDHNYSYPPATLLYTPLFGALPYFWALALWTAISLIAFGLAARAWLAREGAAGWMGIVLPSSILCVWAGHYGLIIGAFWLGAWHTLERRPKLAGILVGMLLIKPHMAILMPLVLFRRKAWLTIAWAALTVMVLIGLSAFIYGPGLWLTYLQHTSGDQLALINASKAMFIAMMPTLAPALFAYGLPASAVWLAQGVVALAAAISLWKFLPKDDYQAGLATAVATFLVLPYAFNYDMTIIGLAAALLLHRPVDGAWRWSVPVAGLIFTLPVTLIFFNRNGLWIAPPLLGLFLYGLLSPRAAPEAGDGAR